MIGWSRTSTALMHEQAVLKILVQSPDFRPRMLYTEFYQTHTQTQTPEELGIFLYALSWFSPSLGPQACTCVGIAITQLIKRHSSIWKWLAVETHSQLQSLDRGSADSRGLASFFYTSHSSLMGMTANLLLSHKPVPVIKTFNGSPLKRTVFILVIGATFPGEDIFGK